MAYTCAYCGRYIGDDEPQHTCTSWKRWMDYWMPETNIVWTYPSYIPEKDTPDCEREDCIYYPKSLIAGKARKCQNKSVLINSEGYCISYVKRKE